MEAVALRNPKTWRFCLGAWLVAAMLLVCAWATADEPSSRERLERAFRCLLDTSFTCRIADKKFLTTFNATSCDYSRLVVGDFAFNKMIFKNEKGEIILVFLNNRDGNFAMANGVWGKVAEILPLHYFENMAEPMSEFEYSIASFSERAVTVDGVRMKEITMVTEADASKLKHAYREFPILGRSDDLTSPDFARRPERRIYFIGERDGFLYGKTCYNFRQQRFYHRKVDRPDFSPWLSEEDFQPDAKPEHDYLMLFEGFLGKNYFDKPVKSQPPPSWLSQLSWKRFLHWLFAPHVLKWIVALLAVTGGGCLVTLLYLRWRESRL